MCYTYLQEIADDSVGGDEKKIAKAARLKADPTFQALMKELETQHSRGFSAHPKMDMLKGLVLQHFGERMGEAEDADATRVMVFVTFRAAVEEIVEVLNTEQPLIRATKFIGQGTDKQGKKGFAQKEQLDVSLCLFLGSHSASDNGQKWCRSSEGSRLASLTCS
jgi:ATP-dependent DNA helicase MPH1